jgi:dTDP-4-amino-4,6-dideoxygalactose transaminase
MNELKVPFFTTKFQYERHKEKINEALIRKAKSGEFILGSSVKEFEEKLSQYTGAKYSIAVASGTDALILALDAMDLPEGSEVITTPFSFFSSTSCIVKNGLKPVFVDVDEKTFNIDVHLIEDKVSKDTSALLPVHLFCQTSQMDEIMRISKKYGLKVLEDSAESFGVRYRGIQAGLIGDAGVLSFFPTKTLGAYGDAGAVITNDIEIAEKVRILRVHGASPKYFHRYIGYNSRMDAIQAEVLKAKMDFVAEEIKEREEVVRLYNKELSEVEEVKTPEVIEGVVPVWYVYSIRARKRDKLRDFLRERGIGTTVYYPRPLHLQECFKYLGYKKGDFPVAEKLCQEALALPLFPGITRDMVRYVCKAIKDFYSLRGTK